MNVVRQSAATLLLLALSPRVHADTSQAAAAQALFEEGKKLVAEGHLAEGCKKLAASEALDPAPGTLLHLGDCYEKNGQLASAWITFKDAASLSTKSGRPEWAQLATERAAQIEQKLPILTIRVAKPASGIEVRRDAVVLPSAVWGSAIPVDPGKYVIEARAPGKKPWRMEIMLGAAARMDVDVPALADETPVATIATVAEPAPAATTRHWQRPVGWASMGLGVVGLGVAGYFGIVTLSKESTADDRCGDGVRECSDAEGLAAAGDAKDAQRLGFISLGVGAALLAGGVVLLLTAPRDRVTASIAAGPMSIVIHGSF
jgi:hypothetical protein